MALSTWWSSDDLPQFPPIRGFTVQPVHDDELMARVNRISLQEVESRRRSGHLPYLGCLDNQPATYGWVAKREASIGELNLAFRLPQGNRYLWDFATLPEFRGKGLYPRLLQEIIAQEMPGAQFFWIIHAPENLPSGVGIDRAGFEPVGQLSFRIDGGVGLQPFENLARAAMGAALLGVPLIDAILSPCWCCGGATEHHCGETEAEACWPPVNPATVQQCSCAIPVKKPNG